MPVGQWEPTEALIRGLLVRVDENDELVLSDELIKCEGNAVLCDELCFVTVGLTKEIHAKQNGETLFRVVLPAEDPICLHGIDLRIDFDIVY